jgi:hypothetical protein
MLLMIDHRLLGDPIDLEDDLVTGAARNDLDPPLLAAQGEGIAMIVFNALPCRPRSGAT